MSFTFEQPDDKDETYTVAELNGEVRSLIERSYRGVWIEAEVTEATRARSGHVYFTLADPGGKAMVSAVMWQGPAMRYAARIAPGRMIRCHGRVTLYEQRGSYQVVADRVEEAGAGVKARMLAELFARLEAEGLFDPARKRPLPFLPSCVGLVTSRSGAALRDILKVAGRRFEVRMVLAHAQVQGESAPAEIAAALDRLAGLPDVDVVILGRGGGSAEDLEAFNSEIVARAIARHPRPVVSAVGHEIDITLADRVADKRAATPSEAAELVVPDRAALAGRVADLAVALKSAQGRRVERSRERLLTHVARLRSRDPRVTLRRSAESLAASREALARWPVLALARARGRLGPLSAFLDALSPLASLARGYSLVRTLPDGRLVRDAREARAGTRVSVTLATGGLTCLVEESREGSREEP
ncbi:MAG: exodeoxyribonuclease VII large subunit [Deltaproteobacteria bacterium]|nr:exodeoxyribonuclease VII large subunit [Deltaproteobacteria bacterium]